MRATYLVFLVEFGFTCMLSLLHTTVHPLQEWVGHEASHLRALGNEIRLFRLVRHPHSVLFQGVMFMGIEDAQPLRAF